MANVQHSALTGSDLHEPKGVDSAASGDVYVADGGGSGTWQKASQRYTITGSLTYNGSSSSYADQYIRFVVPVTGTISRITYSGSYPFGTGGTSCTGYVYNSSGTSNLVASFTFTKNGYGSTTSLSNTSVTGGNYLTFRKTSGASYVGGTVQIQIDRTV